jgi:hypothetical protein
LLKRPKNRLATEQDRLADFAVFASISSGWKMRPGQFVPQEGARGGMCGDDANDAPALRQADSETWPIRLSSLSFAYEFRPHDLAWVDTGLSIWCRLSKVKPYIDSGAGGDNCGIEVEDNDREVAIFDRGATLKMGRIKATREGEPRLLLETAFLAVAGALSEKQADLQVGIHARV